jgi:phosphohistidine phosphatase
MKTLFLIRHAKSSWNDANLTDFERVLNNRGLRDAPFMADLLKKNGVKPDLMLVSTAKRTRLTADFFIKSLAIETSKIIFEEKIYEAAPRTILTIIQDIKSTDSIVLLIGHNPAMTDVANFFSKKFIDNVPTCGIIKIEAAIENWTDFLPENAAVTGIFFPGMYLPGSID